MAERTVFVDAGKRGAHKRWGPPRVINLGDLSPEKRRLILAMVEMARDTAATNEAAPVVIETSTEAASAGGHCRDRIAS